MSIFRTFLNDDDVNDLTPDKLYVPGAYAAIAQRKTSSNKFQHFPQGNGRYKYEVSEIINNWLETANIGGHVNYITTSDLTTISNPHHGDIAVINESGNISVAFYADQWYGPYSLGGTATVTSSAFSAFTGWYIANGTLTDATESDGAVVYVPSGIFPQQVVVQGTAAMASLGYYKVRFVFQSHDSLNTSLATALFPNIQIWDTSGADPVLIQDASIQIKMSAVSSGNITFKFTGINSYSNWLITFSF